jgi:hypothetical protein
MITTTRAKILVEFRVVIPLEKTLAFTASQITLLVIVEKCSPLQTLARSKTWKVLTFTLTAPAAFVFVIILNSRAVPFCFQ